MTLQQLIDITNNLALLLQDHNFNDVHIDFIANFINIRLPGKVHKCKISGKFVNDININDISPDDFGITIKSEATTKPINL